jgi:hypothetical protein
MAHLRGASTDMPKSEDDGFVWALVYRSEIANNSQQPKWRNFTIDERTLCNGDRSRELKLVAWDWSRAAANTYIGELRTSVASLLSDPWAQHGLENATKRARVLARGEMYLNSGSITFFQTTVFEHSTRYLLDYVRGGMQMSLVVGIDMSARNRGASAERECREALQAVSAVLQPYDADNRVPMFGFGVHDRATGRTEQIVPIGGAHEVVGVDGMLAAYEDAIAKCAVPPVPSATRDSLPAITKAAKAAAAENALHEPTASLSAMLHHAALLAAKPFSQRSQHYTILMLITSGHIVDLEASVRELVDASALPLSVVIVALGDGPFPELRALDADVNALEHKGRQAQRDVVQVVEYRCYRDQPSRLAEECLKEIVHQVLTFTALAQIGPNAPVPGSESVSRARYIELDIEVDEVRAEARALADARIALLARAVSSLEFDANSLAARVSELDQHEVRVVTEAYRVQRAARVAQLVEELTALRAEKEAAVAEMRATYLRELQSKRVVFFEHELPAFDAAVEAVALEQLRALPTADEAEALCKLHAEERAAFIAARSAQFDAEVEALASITRDAMAAHLMDRVAAACQRHTDDLEQAKWMHKASLQQKRMPICALADTELSSLRTRERHVKRNHHRFIHLLDVLARRKAGFLRRIQHVMLLDRAGQVATLERLRATGAQQPAADSSAAKLFLNEADEKDGETVAERSSELIVAVEAVAEAVQVVEQERVEVVEEQPRVEVVVEQPRVEVVSAESAVHSAAEETARALVSRILAAAIAGVSSSSHVAVVEESPTVEAVATESVVHTAAEEAARALVSRIVTASIAGVSSTSQATVVAEEKEEEQAKEEKAEEVIATEAVVVAVEEQPTEEEEEPAGVAESTSPISSSSSPATSAEEVSRALVAQAIAKAIASSTSHSTSSASAALVE